MLAAALLVPATLPARTPLWVVGDTGDAWERVPPGFDAEVERMLRQQPFQLCETIAESRVVLSTDPAAVARLETASVALLDDAAADRILAAGTTPHAQYRDILGAMEARRHEAVVERRGSWSRSDEGKLTEVRALLDSGRIDGYRPYLVRAFRWLDRPTGAQVSVCGGYVRTTVHVADDFDPGVRPKPERAAALVFLPRAPTESFAQWIVDVIPVPADWDRPAPSAPPAR